MKSRRLTRSAVWTSAGLQQRPAGRKISGPFLLEHGSADYFPRETSRSDQEAGPAADQPSRLRTPPGVGPRCRRLGAQVNVTRQLIGRNPLAKRMMERCNRL